MSMTQTTSILGFVGSNQRGLAVSKHRHNSRLGERIGTSGGLDPSAAVALRDELVMKSITYIL
jgi:hypothetical protein